MDTSLPQTTEQQQALPLPAPTVSTTIPQPECVVSVTKHTEQLEPFGLKETHTVGVDVLLTMPHTTQRLPSNTICLIDTSGSMGSRASQGAGEQEQAAFSCLDLVKHSLATFVNTLQPQDSITIISFSSTARVDIRAETIDEARKQDVLTTIKELQADGGTNIYAGLQAVVEEVNRFKTVSGGRHSTVFLLSDGQESSSPEGGTSNAFKKLLNDIGRASLTLHTFGYGYDVDTALLAALAQQGTGAFAFIPDATMVGTIFVNFISTVLATAYHHITLSVEDDVPSIALNGDAAVAESTTITTTTATGAAAATDAAGAAGAGAAAGTNTTSKRPNSTSASPRASPNASPHGSPRSSPKVSSLANHPIFAKAKAASPATSPAPSPKSSPRGSVSSSYRKGSSFAAVPEVLDELIYGYAQASCRISKTCADTGMLLFGQTRSFHVRVHPQWRGRIVLRALLPTQEVQLASVPIDAAAMAIVPTHASPTFVREVLARSLLTTVKTKTNRADAPLLVEKLTKMVAQLQQQAAPADTEYFAALTTDLTGDTDATGQIGKAVQSADNYSRWGFPYLLGLALCHRMQITQNFKDASLQQYGGALFTELQQTTEEIFCKLPPPPPSVPALTSRGGVRPPSPTNMTGFYNRYGGCFFGPNVVLVRVPAAVSESTSLNGTVAFKRIDELQRDDMVLCGDGQYRAIACVVVSPRVDEQQTALPTHSSAGALAPFAVGAKITMYDVGQGVLLTAYHPVWNSNSGRWAFPIDCGVACTVSAVAVYNFVLADGGTDMVVFGASDLSIATPASAASASAAHAVRGITLGHNIVGDVVAEHEYLGTSRVVADLQRMQGWATGRVVLDERATVRDEVTSRIVHWVEMQPSSIVLGC